MEDNVIEHKGVRESSCPPPLRFGGKKKPQHHDGRTDGDERERSRGKFVGTHIVIDRFETDRCEAVARDEIVF